MRIFYCRRLLFPLFVLSILFMFFLIFQASTNKTPDVSLWAIYKSSGNCTDQSISTSSSPPSSIQFLSVPPNYLVIPYREFALRTSISCKAFKLDNPSNNPDNLYPKYSKYLRGRFPYVLPDANITFDDVETFYTDTLVNTKTSNSSIDTSFAKNITFENIPYKFEDGLWHPIGVISAQRTAIIVPLQGREYNAKAFLLNMHAFFRRQQLTYTIVLVEQVFPREPRFNKGRLYNTAVQYVRNQTWNITCLILHDVDLIPEDDGNFYTCESRHPKHTTSRVRKLDSDRGYTKYYEFLIGGVLILTYDMYRHLNGFSNLYWGWGGEDDDLALRLVQKRMCVVRPSFELAVYIGLPHPHGKRNSARFGLLTWTTLRVDHDGLAQIPTLTEIVQIDQRSTVIHLKVDVYAERNLPKTSSNTALLSSTIQNVLRENETNQKLSKLNSIR